MNEHTKGPWEIKEPQSIEMAGYTIRDSNTMGLAGTYGRDDDREELANARLIAAAPELLAALRTMHTHHTREGTVPYGHEPGSKPDICYACAAISRATGGE